MSNSTLAEPEAPIRPLVSVRDARIRVEPGQIGTTELTIRNPGSIVETYDVVVLGPAGAWVSVEPVTVSLFPGDEQDVTVTFQPPVTSRIVAGEYAVGFQVTSQVHQESSATAETVVTVPPYYRFRLLQAQSAYTVRTKATTLVRIVNEGNSTVTYSVQATDPEGFMRVFPREPKTTLAPGESRWVEIEVKVAPKIIGSGFETRAYIITVTPLRDEDVDLPIVDVDAEEIGASIVHRPFIRVRLGVLGRLILLLTILGLIAGFIITRILANQPSSQVLGPAIPANLAATLAANERDVVMTWAPSNGATSYSIYALGAAGNPVPPTPQPVIVQAPAGGAVARGVAIPREDNIPSNLPTPVCSGCSLVADVASGTTRHVIESAPPGLACYRVIAKRGELQSLFSPKVCVQVPEVVDLNANGVPDAEEGVDFTILPCPPTATEARPLSGTAVAIMWKPSLVPPPGFITPDNPAAAAAIAASAPVASETEAAASSTRGGPIGPDKPNGDSSGVRVCDPGQEITGWVLQRKIFTGWSNVDPPPAAKDTAVEVRDLEPRTRYCFRMASVSAEGDSEYTERFCVRTPPGSTGGSGADEAGDPTPTTAPASPSSDPTGVAPSTPASVVIENVR